MARTRPAGFGSFWVGLVGLTALVLTVTFLCGAAAVALGVVLWRRRLRARVGL